MNCSFTSSWSNHSLFLLKVAISKACVIEEFVNDALDCALDWDGMEDETGEEDDKVLTTIAARSHKERVFKATCTK
nr:hypothetical protein [Tanacetum cinerariifolium]